MCFPVVTASFSEDSYDHLEISYFLILLFQCVYTFKHMQTVSLLILVCSYTYPKPINQQKSYTDVHPPYFQKTFHTQLANIHHVNIWRLKLNTSFLLVRTVKRPWLSVHHSWTFLISQTKAALSSKADNGGWKRDAWDELHRKVTRRKLSPRPCLGQVNDFSIVLLWMRTTLETQRWAKARWAK